MGYSVYGRIKYADGTAAVGIKVLPYFKKVDSESDSSRWSTQVYTSDASGYYAYSPEDDNLLTSEGSYKKTKDKFYCLYYDGTTKDSLTMAYASFHDHTIPSDDELEINITIEPKRSPIIASSTFPSVNLLTKHNYTMSESSYADTSWLSSAYGEDVSQKLIYDSVDIFDGHQLVNTDYDWGDGSQHSVANNSSKIYQYTIAGVYTQRIRVNEKWNTYTELVQEVTVKYSEPTADFNWTPTETNSWQGSRVKGQELITFHNLSSDIDDRTWDSTTWGAETYTYNWTITDNLQDGSDNTQTYTSQAYDYEPTHAFQSAGTKTITLEVYWNDGFDDYVETIVKTIEVYAYDIVIDFTWIDPDNRGQDVTFNPDSTTGDVFQISRYDWVLVDNYPAPDVDLYTFADVGTSIFGEGSPDNSQVVDNTYTIDDTQYPTVKYHSLGAKDATVTVTYYNGWVDVTETLTKQVNPIELVTEPTFTISDDTPMGRDKNVVMTNTTNYILNEKDVGYTIDWKLNDEYSECNLDNPTPGTIVDRYKELIDVANDTTIDNNYHTTSPSDVELTIRYDNGWQRVTKRLTQTVTPEVYPEPIPDFTWDITVPTSREETVTFSNTTSDADTRYRAYGWTIPDSYNKWNPDNSNYGVDVLDNTQTIPYSTDYALTPTHNFQDNVSRDIEMVYYYDDGFCERTVDITKAISFTEYSIVPIISEDTANQIGMVEVAYTNASTGDTSRMLDERWEWNDVTFPDYQDNITVRDDQTVMEDQPYTWQYPSRKPYSAIDGATAANVNKTVGLEVRIDTGWRDDTDDGAIGDHNSADGGQVYFSTANTYEAKPKELSSEITYECNVEGYTHGV